VAVLAITGSVFAYTFTTATVTIGVTAIESDFANVSANLSGWTNPKAFGKFTGTWDQATLFNMSPHGEYTGDLIVHVYLTNAGELIRRYHHLNLKLELHDSLGANVSVQGEYQVLNLNNADVVFEWGYGNGTAPYYVDLVGGSYRLHPWRTGLSGSVQPEIFCEVTQR
jgi:hypothetical protein